MKQKKSKSRIKSLTKTKQVLSIKNIKTKLFFDIKKKNFSKKVKSLDFKFVSEQFLSLKVKIFILIFKSQKREIKKIETKIKN